LAASNYELPEASPRFRLIAGRRFRGGELAHERIRRRRSSTG
jgi:hypothetical protein